jgi:hypothetical protein
MIMIIIIMQCIYCCMELDCFTPDQVSHQEQMQVELLLGNRVQYIEMNLRCIALADVRGVVHLFDLKGSRYYHPPLMLLPPAIDVTTTRH